MNKILGGLIAAVCADGTSRNSMAAHAYDDTGAWYLSPLAQYSLLDH